MTPSQITRITAAILAAIALSACTSASHGAINTSTIPVTAQQSDPQYIAQARADSIRLPYTQADVDFMSGMIGHHAQAIVMSRWAPTHGASPSVLTLASRIINAQQDEIVTMQRWLRDRGKAGAEG